jgi:hypothetical protein
MDEVVEVQAFTKVNCIMDMSTHVVKGTKRVTKGAQYEDEWCFYHTTLSQMPYHKIKEWMQTTGYIRYWILPLRELNTGTVYARRPTDDPPPPPQIHAAWHFPLQ